MRADLILIAGIGNIFFGDDAFGVEVVRRLAQITLPEGVVVRDFGIRGFDLAFALQDGYHAVLLIDAICRHGTPGSLYVIDPDLEFSAFGDPQEVSLQTHNLDPLRVIRLAKSMSDRLPKVLLLGCEPARVDFDESGEMALSESVQQAASKAVDMIPALVDKLRRSGAPSIIN